MDRTLSLNLNSKALEAGLKKVHGGLASVQQMGVRVARSVGRGFDGLKNSIFNARVAVTGLVAALSTGKFLGVNKDIQKLEVSLRAVTGSTEQAGLAMKYIQDIATQIPETVDDTARAFIKMRALGLAPTREAMLSFADTSAAMGKGLMDMIEAVADASTGEFERLKEFGIKSSAQGSKVIFTFKGIKTEVENTSDAITDYLIKVGQSNFAGAATEQMDTLGGSISNLGVAFDQLLVRMGESGINRWATNMIKGVTRFITEVTKNFDLIEISWNNVSASLKLGWANLDRWVSKIVIGIAWLWDKMLYNISQAWTTFVGTIQQSVNNISEFVGAGEVFSNVGFEANNAIKPLADINQLLLDQDNTYKKLAVSIEAARVARENEILGRPSEGGLTAAQEAGITSSGPKTTGPSDADTKLLESIMTEEEQLGAAYARRTQMLMDAKDRDLITEQRYNELSLQQQQKYFQDLDKLQSVSSQATLSVSSDMFGALASLAQQGGKKYFKIWKMMARAQAIVDTYSAATAAYKAMAGIPVVGPALGAAAATAAVIAGMARVAAINKTQFSSTSVGGVGGASGGVSGVQAGTIVPSVSTQTSRQEVAPIEITFVIQSTTTGEVVEEIKQRVNSGDEVLIGSESANAQLIRTGSYG